MAALRILLFIVLGWAMALGTSALADEVALTPDDYALLIGTWEGPFASKNTNGKVRFSTDTQLDIVEGGSGKFWLKQNDQKWDTTVDIKDGKVVLTFGHKDRPFVYEKDGDSATLSVKYDSEFEGYPRKDSLTLTKQSE